MLLWAIPVALIGFGIYKFWEKYGEDIRKGIDVRNCSVGAIALARFLGIMISINLFGMWLMVVILLVLIGWNVWGCKKHRGWCLYGKGMI